jgi:spermidine/putrescine transport system permease protein
MKKTLAIILAACLMAALLTACGGTIPTTGAASPSESGSPSQSAVGTESAGASPAAAAGGELNVFVWTEYMPDSVFQKFTEETGVKVNVSTYSSNEDMLSKVKASNKGIYDIVVPSDYMVKMMIAEGLLAELDKAKIPNIKNIGPQYLNQSYDPDNKHSVPYMGGVATLCVNTDRVKEDITSFEQIFDPKYANSIVALDDFRAVIGLTAKTLGYGMSETDAGKLKEIGEKLMKLKPNIKALDSDSPKTLMISGETTIGYMWNAEAALAIAENPKIKIVFPKEGAYLFLDNLCVLDGAKNKENAEKFIDFILRPDVSKLVSDEFPYLNPNAEAVKLLGDAYINNPASNIPQEVFEKGEYIQDVGSAVDTYSTLWTEFTK